MFAAGAHWRRRRRDRAGAELRRTRRPRDEGRPLRSAGSLWHKKKCIWLFETKGEIITTPSTATETPTEPGLLLNPLCKVDRKLLARHG